MFDWLRTGTRRKELFDALRRVLADARLDRDGIAGTRDGLAVFVELGDAHGVSTAIEVMLPAAYPVVLDIRDKWFDGDLSFGDPVLDDRYSLAGAPRDVVKRLVDAAFRAFLAKYPRACMGTEHFAGALRFSFGVRVDDVDAITEAIAQLVRFTAGLRDAYAAGTQPVQVGAPFRPGLDDSAERALTEQRAREVEALRAKLARR